MYHDISPFGVREVARPPSRSLPTYAGSPPFSLPDSRGCLVAAPVPSSLIMNHHRHLPLFIVVRSHLIYRRDSRAYYSCFLFRRLRIYYSAARFHFVFYRCARLRPVRKPRPIKSTLLRCIELNHAFCACNFACSAAERIR